MMQKLLLFCALGFVSEAAERPRGVPVAKASFYLPAREFMCITSKQRVPWEYVNDDYCDCEDGSDEPGTSACPNGSFYCENRGHYGMDIFSSQVNDGICDCCDGSDEYEERIKCVNRCLELGRQDREERESFRLLQEQGYKLKQEFIQQNKRNLEEKQTKIAELEQKLPELTALQTEAHVYKNSWQWEKDRVKGVHAFAELDVNGDKEVDYVEVQAHKEFDMNSDGTVSIEEARQYLDENDIVDKVTFEDKIWPKMKDVYKPPADLFDSPPADQNRLMQERLRNKQREEEQESMPPYDDFTTRLIDAANKARNEFINIDSKVRALQKEIGDLKKFVDMDLGPEGEYGALQGQCFEFTERDYTYVLCPFEKAAQKPKAGGIETTLGKWGHWHGPVEDKYDSMKYDNGQRCWNGPMRSCRVNLHCGTENKLTGASEPSRCEYQFEFTTPARCKHPDALLHPHKHAEL
ncbi:glucosidase 2 subunit beta-like isoform X2 [Babylonia areolata]|uniref:glucosidase 2 subunit beta-like isoform X2 n=1 Tax=Babylonia areolata TaxID=304850 RepID=UPI003FD64792